MQNKKRAKPVKFNQKKKEEDKVKETEEKLDEKIQEEPLDEEAEEKETESKKEHKERGLEAHLTTTTTSLDIEEFPVDEDEKKVDLSEKEENFEDDMPEDVTEKEDEEKEFEGEDLEERGEESDENTQKSEDVDESPLNKDGAFFNVPPDDQEKKKSSLPYFVMIVVITFILGLVFFAGIYYAVTNKSKILPGSSNNNATVTQAPEEVEPTKKPVDLSKYTIQVLNGTGTSGVAAKVKELLAGEGFNVSSIGNAENSDFEKTEIAVSEKVEKEYIEKLKEVLGKTYVLGKETTIDSGSTDVVVTIGSESAE